MSIYLERDPHLPEPFVVLERAGERFASATKNEAMELAFQILRLVAETTDKEISLLIRDAEQAKPRLRIVREDQGSPSTSNHELTVDQLDDVVTVPDAAERLGIPQSRIRTWAARGKITRVNPDGPRPYFRLIDVARVERDLRRRATSHLRPVRG